MTENELCQKAYDLARENGEQIVFLGRVLIMLSVFVVLKLIIIAISSMRNARILTRVESLLALAEAHGVITDDRVNELKGNTADAIKKVSAVVVAQATSVKKEVPTKVVEKMEEKAAERSGDSGAIPTVKPSIEPAG